MDESSADERFGGGGAVMIGGGGFKARAARGTERTRSVGCGQREPRCTWEWLVQRRPPLRRAGTGTAGGAARLGPAPAHGPPAHLGRSRARTAPIVPMTSCALMYSKGHFMYLCNWPASSVAVRRLWSSDLAAEGADPSAGEDLADDVDLHPKML